MLLLCCGRDPGFATPGRSEKEGLNNKRNKLEELGEAQPWLANECTYDKGYY
jgi:hypothetical protein